MSQSFDQQALSVDKEARSTILVPKVGPERIVANDKSNDDNEEHSVVEVFIDHVVSVVGAHARQVEVISPGKHLGRRLKSRGEGPQAVQVRDGDSVAQVTHIVDWNDSLVHHELVALQLLFHGRLDKFLLELLGIRQREPSLLLGHLLGSGSSGRVTHLRELVKLVLVSDEDHSPTSDVMCRLCQ